MRLAAAACTLAAPLVAQGRVVTDTLHSRALRGNLIGDSPDREVLVYLPPSYDRAPATRYPVLYLLHGMTSHPREWLDGSYQGFDLRVAMDSLAAAGGREFLVVMPHADNALGGTFYTNSAALGRWDDFTARELVAFVDARYRTLRARGSRGLAGHSMGGFGVLYLAARHPDTFGSIHAMSACCMGFVGEMAPESATWREAAAARIDTARRAAAVTQRVRAMAAAFAPRPASSAAHEPLPFAPDTLGHLRPDAAVLRSWREHLPLERLARDRQAFGRFAAIGLDYGRSDQIASVGEGTRDFARALDRYGIRYTLDAYDGGHIDRVRERFERVVLPFFARTLDGEHDERRR